MGGGPARPYTMRLPRAPARLPPAMHTPSPTVDGAARALIAPELPAPPAAPRAAITAGWVRDEAAHIRAEINQARAVYDLYLAAAELARALGDPIPLPDGGVVPPALNR